MIIFIRVLFGFVFASMLGVSVYASHDRALWDLPSEVVSDPWFVATLMDAYWGFLVFWLWVAYRESSLAAKVGWLLGLLLLGNMAVAVYMLIRLFRMGSKDSIESLLLRPEGLSER